MARIANRDSMKLPLWAEDDIESLPKDFTGQIVIVFWQGGVTRIETKTIRTAPKVGEKSVVKSVVK